MKVIDLPSEYKTLQDYVMKDVKEKVVPISLEKGTKLNRCWLVKNARNNKRIIYGSIIKDNKETIVSLEYMLLMKIHLVISFYTLDVLSKKLKLYGAICITSVEIYKLDEICFNNEYKELISELLLLYKKDK